MKNVTKHFRFSDLTAAWLKQLAEEEELSETGVLEWLIRREAKRRKLPTLKAPKEPQ